MVIIDAGHGGADSGASSGDIKEKDYTLKISNCIFKKVLFFSDKVNFLAIICFFWRC